MMDYMKNSTSYRPLASSADVSDFSSLTEDVAIADITKVGPDLFAKQITLIELSLFKAIKREEFSSLKWNGKEKHIHAPNIVASTRWFNQINFWVQKEILKYSCVSKRTELLAFFIKIAKKLVDYNNLYSAMSIVSALQVECVYRLRHTWDGLSNKDRAAYRRLEELFSQNDNCRRQREHMNSIVLPGIPYLGLYLSDLTYTNVAHPRVGGKPTSIWTAKINAIIDVIAYFQQSEYPFNVDGTINAYLCAQRYIEELQKFLEEDNYRTSLRLEPQPEPVIRSCPVYVPAVTDNDRVMAGFMKCPNDPPSNRALRSTDSAPRPHTNHVRSSSKSASVNSSFESDLIPMCKSVLDNSEQGTRWASSVPHRNPSMPSDLVAANASTPIIRTKKKNYDGPTSNKPSKVMFSDEEVFTDSPIRKISSGGEFSRSNSKDSLANSSKHAVDDETSYCMPPNHRHSQSEIVHSTIVKCPYPENLPPIPPRPAQRCSHLNEHQVPYQNKPRQQHPSHLPPSNSNNALSPEHDPPRDLHNSVTKPELSGEQSVTDAAVSNDVSESPTPSSILHTPATQSAPFTSTPAKRVSAVPPVSQIDSLDAAAAAVCAATICASEFGRLQLQTKLDLSSPLSTPEQKQSSGLDDAVPQQSSCTRNLPSASTPIVHVRSDQRQCTPDRKISIPSSIGLSQFDVHIVYQGVVQRRTMVQPRTSAPTSLSALLSPKMRKDSSTIYESTSSLSTASAIVCGPDSSRPSVSTLAHARPAGLSSWRRLWATLVVVGPGSGAFMIYFEPRFKNAMLRNEFYAHQCQVQNLMNFQSFQSITTSPSKLFPDSANHHPDYLEETDGEASELLQTSADLSTAEAPPHHTSRGYSVSSTTRSGLFNVWAQVELGRHRDGTVDGNSFLLSDPNRLKVYRFRPLLEQDSPASLTLSSGPLDWLRRSGLHSPRVNPRASESCAIGSESVRPPRAGFSSLGRPRGASVPSALTWSLVSPSSSRTATLEQTIPGLSTFNPVVDEWINALKKALNAVEQFHYRQFISHHARRYCEDNNT